ncbi:hypothetical protein GCM10009526_10660 [Glutamicibacter creatinolyticus]
MTVKQPISRIAPATASHSPGARQITSEKPVTMAAATHANFSLLLTRQGTSKAGRDAVGHRVFI